MLYQKYITKLAALVMDFLFPKDTITLWFEQRAKEGSYAIAEELSKLPKAPTPPPEYPWIFSCTEYRNLLVEKIVWSLKYGKNDKAAMWIALALLKITNHIANEIQKNRISRESSREARGEVGTGKSSRKSGGKSGEKSGASVGAGDGAGDGAGSEKGVEKSGTEDGAKTGAQSDIIRGANKSANEDVEDGKEIIIFVPIPSSKKRQKTRGYDHIALIVNALRDLITENNVRPVYPLNPSDIMMPSARIPIYIAPLLHKTRHTKPQKETDDRDARLHNLSGAFSLDIEWKEKIERAIFATNTENLKNTIPFSCIHAVIIDDVCTTGSTLETARLALLPCGFASIIGMVFAR